MTAAPSLFSGSPTDFSLRAQYDHRRVVTKIIDAIKSLFRQIQYSLTVLYYRLSQSNPQRCGQEINWNPESRGLVVLLHGLRNDPAAWYFQLSLLHQHPQIDTFAPIIPKRGMCSLDEAATPVLPTLLDYIKKNPKKPLCLLGVSNGSRIVTWLETKLREDAPQTPVMVSTIAGVHLGSRRMNLLEKCGIARWFYPSKLQQELKYGSDKAKELFNRVTAPLPERCAPRDYEFYASTEDLSVPDLGSSLPNFNKGERFHVVHGHSHDSIVTAVAQQQITSCIQWINKFDSSRD